VAFGCRGFYLPWLQFASAFDVQVSGCRGFQLPQLSVAAAFSCCSFQLTSAFDLPWPSACRGLLVAFDL
jgi:hypothetical protein